MPIPTVQPMIFTEQELEQIDAALMAAIDANHLLTARTRLTTSFDQLEIREQTNAWRDLLLKIQAR